MRNSEAVTIGDILQPARRSVGIEPAANYVAIGMKSFGKGIFHYPPTPGAELSKLRYFHFPAGALALSNIKAWEGAIGVTSEADAAAVASNRFLFYVPTDERRVDVRYLRHYFLSEPGLSAIGEASPGSADRNRTLSIKGFQAIRIPLPSVEEQRRIVDLIDTADSVIRQVALAIDRLAALRGQIVKSVQGDGKTAVLNEIATVSQGRGLPRECQGVRTGDISWFKIADMSSIVNLFGYHLASTQMTAKEIESRGGRVHSVGTVVFPRVGGSILTNNKRILDVEAAVDENHLVIEPQEGVDPEFLLGAIEGVRLSDLAQAGAVPSINMGIVRSIRLPWIKGERQEALGEAFRAIRFHAMAMTAQMGKLQSLRSEVAAALLSGTHEIPESYDDLLGA
ncbi:hypothetical protein GCM10020358_37960 [Amorphoplanes nipponensis]|uniref:Type I restriction enzyme, S subunit n=1 Tax=Actinoplanes nipponensis TaxID=135950 RepID=A0A919JT37_9ACTN|nr:hypothetical protein [Actinoplanes nipponensis]GIE52464.1 hypothetical protein Ani05nite_59980 [Actinoplanes nipponensis]